MIARSPAWRAILDKAEAGERITRQECLELYQQTPLPELSRTAHALRCLRTDPSRVTYLIDRNINYTNVCITDCTFCGFYRRPGDKEAYTLSREQIGRKIRETLDAGGTRILMQGGHNPDLPLPWYVDLLRWIRAEFPSIEIDAFSPSEIDHLAGISGLSMEDVLRALKDAGLHGLPGGGGEILDDEVRSRVSRKKQNSAGWLEAMRIAQRLGLYTSATNVIGLGETLEQRITHIDRLRDLQAESLAAHGNGFAMFAAWPVQLENNALGANRRRRDELGASAVEYLRHTAISRIYLDNFDHIQASWPTMGPDIAQIALFYGADDFGSTMLEENVVSASGSVYHCLPEADMHKLIRQAGFRPAQRSSLHVILKEFAATT